MTIQKTSDIKKEVSEVKEKGKETTSEMKNLAAYAERLKATFKQLEGDATEEGDSATKQAVEASQAALEKKYDQTKSKYEEVKNELQKTEQDFQQAGQADQRDITKLNSVAQEAKKVGADDTALKKAVISKQIEINFLTEQNKDIDKTQKEMKADASESQKRKQSAKFKHQSKGTLRRAKK
jgi:chromosome segregation ATPase